MKKMCISAAAAAMAILGASGRPQAATCVSTGFAGLTAALVNPGHVSGTVNATGCDVGVYFDTGRGSVRDAQVYGARSFGVFVNGDAQNVAVDILDSHIFFIGDQPFNGNQRGVAIYYRAFFATRKASGRISGNVIELYQKGGHRR